MRQVLCCLLVAAIMAACGPDRNQPPTVEASASATEVSVGQEVTVDGSSSADPDGDPLLFRWALNAPDESSVELDNPRTSKITFAPDVAGTYTVQLSVDDGEFESPLASVTVEVTGTGAPVVNAGPDQSVEVGEEVTLDGTNSSDPNGDELTYQWSFEQKPQGSTAEFSDATVAQPTFVADVAGDFIVGLVVSDGEFTSEPDTVIVSVGGDGNQPPVADAGEGQTAIAGVEVILDASGSSDPDSSELTYFWQVVSQPEGSDVLVEGATTKAARFTPTREGAYEIELTVSDGDKDATDTVIVTVEGSFSSVCLLISEYIEGHDYTKGIEIYNCSGQMVDLSGFGLQVVRGGTTPGTDTVTLSGSVAQEDVLTVCRDRTSNGIDDAKCDISTSNLTHTGDDSLFIFEDVDGVEGFGATDLVVDAFGNIENPPASPIWDDLVLRRCDFTRLNGRYASEGFDWRDYFVKGPDVDTTTDFTDDSDFGVKPTEGCS